MTVIISSTVQAFFAWRVNKLTGQRWLYFLLNLSALIQFCRYHSLFHPNSNTDSIMLCTWAVCGMLELAPCDDGVRTSFQASGQRLDVRLWKNLPSSRVSDQLYVVLFSLIWSSSVNPLSSRWLSGSRFLRLLISSLREWWFIICEAVGLGLHRRRISSPNWFDVSLCHSIRFFGYFIGLTACLQSPYKLD